MMKYRRSMMSMFLVAGFGGFGGLNAADAAIIQRLEAGQSMNVCAIGTSLTDGPWNQNQFHAAGWFEQVGAWLQGRYPGKVNLYNRAVAAAASKYTPSYTTPTDGMSQLNTVLTTCNPDAIFLEFAVNDAYTPYAISPAASQANLRSMISQIRTWGANRGKIVDIVVLAMNDAGGIHQTYRPNLAQYYANYRAIALGADDPLYNPGHLLYVDNYIHWSTLHASNLSLWNTYVADGIHPSPLGSANVTVPQVKTSLLQQVPEPASFSLLMLAGGLMLGMRPRVAN